MKSLRAIFRWTAGPLLILAVVAGSSAFPPTVTLTLLGDVMVGRGIAQAHAGGDGGDALGALAPVLQKADLTAANLESPLGDGIGVDAGPSEAYNLCAPFGALAVLTGADLDVLSTANNHAADCGDASASRLILQDAGFTVLRPGQVVEITRNGLRLVFIALDDVTSALDVTGAAAMVRQAKAGGAVVIVSIHWGLEYHQTSSERQREIGAALAAAGADLIWGHHPHVLQPIEEIPRGEGERPTLAAYSLGNALFDQVVPASARRSEILTVRLDSRGVVSYAIVPVVIDPFEGGSVLDENAAPAE